jgi:hypothetical protein
MASNERVVYREWSPFSCPLAAAVLSGMSSVPRQLMFTLGLYRIPVRMGDGVCAIDCPRETLGYIADILGPTGSVCAWISSPVTRHVELGEINRLYPNIVVDHPFPGGRLYQARDLTEICYELLLGSYGRGPLSSLRWHKQKFIQVITHYLDACTIRSPLGCIFIFFPPDLRPLSNARFSDYEQHLIRTLEPLCRLRREGTLASTFWIILELRFAEITDLEVDLFCDRTFDSISNFARPTASIRPKEQLRINPEYMHNTVLLSARYRSKQ